MSFAELLHDPDAAERRREPSHVPLRAYATADEALRRTLSDEIPSSRWVLPLTPAAWSFHLAPRPTSVPRLTPRGFEGASSWATLTVPKSWELAGHSRPMYTNVRYPFPLTPPAVPTDESNPTGCYQRSFTLPAEWEGRRAILRLDGVSAALLAYVDGVELGFSDDSKLPVEFDLTAALGGSAAGEYTLSVLVPRWSAGSYLEGQDQWWLSGIARHCWIYSKPRAAAIVDFHAAATPSASLDAAALAVEVRLRCEGGEPPAVRASLHAPHSLALVWREEAEASAAAPPSAACVGGGTHSVFFSARLDAPALWTAETPALYTLVVELLPPAAADVEACWLGVRRVGVEGGRLCVNGTPITVRGVNRHEHCPDGGKAVGLAHALRDVALMKRHSFNAVRLSHYPNVESMYDVCDALGMYVVDEANVETHGFTYGGDWSRLAREPAWRGAFLARLQRMVRRDKNHACVIAWSLGNEAGYAAAHDAMAAWCRAADPLRPVQYESCGGGACTDILSPMYPTPAAVRALASPRAQRALRAYSAAIHPPRRGGPLPLRPVVLSEYAHSMGNSTGNLDEWWRLFRELPHAQGGFVWDWVDQGLPRRGAGGGTHWAYGGDFGDSPHDGAFCINGLVFPDRTPHPALFEAKHAMRPIATRLEAAAALPRGVEVRLAVENRFDFLRGDELEARGVEARCVLTVDGHAAARATARGGEVREALAAPRGEGSLRVALHTAAALTGAEEVAVLVEWVCGATSWCEEGHVLAQDECVLSLPPPAAPLPPAPPPPPAPPLVCVDGGDGVLEVRGAAFSVRISKADGRLCALEAAGQRVLDAGGELCLWRAPTDNDKGSPLGVTHPAAESIAAMPRAERLVRTYVLPFLARHGLVPLLVSWEAIWRRHGLHALSRRLLSLERTHTSADEVAVASVCEYLGHETVRAVHRQTVVVRSCGDVLLYNHVDLRRKQRPWDLCPFSAARLGQRFTLPAAAARVRWWGRGPHENYPDRKAGALLGRYEAALDEMSTPYIVPSENGHRCDVRCVELVGTGGAGLAVRGVGQPFGFSASRHSLANLEHAAHTDELVDSGAVHLNVDHQMMGVGGDVSWVRSVYRKYWVPHGSYRWAVQLVPFVEADGGKVDLPAPPEEPAWPKDAAPRGGLRRWLARAGLCSSQPLVPDERDGASCCVSSTSASAGARA